MVHFDDMRDLINVAGFIIDVAGVAIILLGVTISTLAYLVTLLRGGEAFRLYRKNVGRSILLGLEFLVGGDIIRTVSVAHPSLADVLTLGLIVMIRTAMSFAMEVELEGRWPWQARSLAAPPPDGDDRPAGA